MNDPRRLDSSQFPEDWNIIKAKHLFRQVGEKGFPDELMLSATQDRGVVPQDTLEQRAVAAFRGLENFKLVRPNDFVISLRSFQGGIEYSSCRGIISPAYTVLRPRHNLPLHYFRHYLKDHEFIARLNAVASGIREGKTIRYEEFAQLELLVPPRHTGEQIAAFLDRETAKLDALVTRQERLIELLQEKRAALISHVVTKGLDLSVPMKDSGIPWLGVVPEHWDVQSLKTVALLQRGHDLPAQERESGDVPVVSSSGISGYHIEAKAKGPGVVTGRYGTIGEIIYVDQDYWPLNTTLYVKNFHENWPRFVYYLLMILPFDAFSGKSAVPGVDRNDLHRLLVTCPPLDEQENIAAYLDRETAKLDTLIAKAREMVARLQEYRTALISSAVTGKIDVRQEVL